MKKLLAVFLTLVLSGLLVVGCAGSALADAGFTEESDGVYTYLDTTDSPLEAGGLKIEVTTGEEGSVKFTITDDSGTETADYFLFTPADKQMFRHYYVAAMGVTFNYYFNYDTGELDKITDGDDVDKTEATKMSGRWDSAVSSCATFASDIISYFETNFEITLDEAIK